MSEKQYLKMADVPVFPDLESKVDIEYLNKTPESWCDDYRRLFESEQVAKRNKMQLFAYSKKLRDMLIKSINSHDELVAENERLREMVSRMGVYLELSGEYPEKESDNPIRQWLYESIEFMHGGAS